jgi:hypothetical protein
MLLIVCLKAGPDKLTAVCGTVFRTGLETLKLFRQTVREITATKSVPLERRQWGAAPDVLSSVGTATYVRAEMICWRATGGPRPLGGKTMEVTASKS